MKKISVTVELDDKKSTSELYKKHKNLFEAGLLYN